MSRAGARLRRVVVLCVATSWLHAALAQDPAAGADPFVVGIGRSINDPEASADALARLGVRSLRLDAPWKSIESAPGRYYVPAWLDAAVDAARAHDIEPLLILAYGHPLYGDDKPRTPAAIAAFGRYAMFVTRHFEGRVRYFDLWNEWDAGTGRTTPGNPEDYVELARNVYPAVKSATPGVVVLSGGIASLGIKNDWMERFIAAGGLKLIDGLSLHPYNFQQRDSTTPEAAIAELDRLHGLAAAAGRPLPIYVTEMGYPTFDGRGGVSRDVAALYLARFLLLASTRPYVAGTWWYCLRDQGNDPANKEHNFGVLDSKLRSKPAGDALRAVATLIRDVRRFRDESTSGDAAAGETRVSGTRADGSTIVLAWNAAGTDTQLLRDLAAATTTDARPVSNSRRR